MGVLDRLRRDRRASPDRGVETGRWLVAGLGNPEREYGGTRHNVGADTVRLLAGRLGASLRTHKVGGEVADAFDRPGGTPLSLVVPSGYMNNSGGPVQRASAFYRVPSGRLVVVHDDIDLSPARLRLKRGGGTAGHNGLKDIQRRLGTTDFLRVRIGVGRPPGRQDPAAYVLRRFSPKEREEIDVTIQEAADAILLLVDDGLEAAQNRYHTR
ncbi:MAG: aminoacyl-tRNA hydrolase [Nitriliruptorales bacterium]|nr:aminoacyl-tRNA hydrolase [Nitriliruptorales bacterium]